MIDDRYKAARSNRNWIIGSGVLVVSFLITLWISAPKPPADVTPPPPQTPLAIFKSINVIDPRSLSAAGALAGLKATGDIKSIVDEVSRSTDGRAKIKGWAVDLDGPGAPISVLVFAAGNYVFEVQTKGPRADVAQSLKIPAALAANATFEGAFSCTPGLPLYVVAVSQANKYAAIGQHVCPS